MKRVVAVAAASIDAVNAVHASVIQERNERRGIAALAAGAAGLAAGAGFGGQLASRERLSLPYSLESPEIIMMTALAHVPGYENFFSASSEASRTARSGSLWLSASILSLAG